MARRKPKSRKKPLSHAQLRRAFRDLKRRGATRPRVRDLKRLPRLDAKRITEAGLSVVITGLQLALATMAGKPAPSAKRRRWGTRAVKFVRETDRVVRRARR